MTPLRINPEIKAGDILTSLSILISLIALLVAWAKDRKMRNKEQADKVRSAAARTLSKLERWRELNIWFFRAIQPSFVKTSEMLLDEFDVVAARDHLWKELNAIRLQTHEKVLDEEIEVAYVELYAYHPKVHDLFVNTLEMLKQKERVSFDDLLIATESEVMYFNDHEDEYTTAALGNALRKKCYEQAQAFKEEVTEVIKPIHTYLYKLISSSDNIVLQKDRILALDG